MSETVRIGILYDYPFEGDALTPFDVGFEVGLSEIIDTGRIDAKVELIKRKANGLPSGSAEDVSRSFFELEKEGAHIVIGPCVSDNAVVIRDDAAKTQLPTIQWSGGEEARGEWMFHYQLGSLSDEPPLMAERMVERGFSRPAILFDDSIVGRGYLKSFQSSLQRLGIEIKGAFAIDSLAQDVQTTLSEAKEKNPDCVIYFGIGAASHAVATGLIAMEWSVPVLANSGLIFGYYVREWRDAFKGWEYPDTISDDNEVRKKLVLTHPKLVSNPMKCGGYDVGRLVGEALARAPELSRAGIADGLRQIKHIPAASGYDGTVMGFGCWDHAALKGRFLVLREWVDGKSVQVVR